MNKKYSPAEQLIVFRDVLKEFTASRKEKIMETHLVDFKNVPFYDAFNFIMDQYVNHNMIPNHNEKNNNLIQFVKTEDVKYQSSIRLVNDDGEFKLGLFNSYDNSISFKSYTSINCEINSDYSSPKFNIPIEFYISKRYADTSSIKFKSKDKKYINSISEELKLITENYKLLVPEVIDFFSLDNRRYGVVMHHDLLWTKVAYVLKKKEIFPLKINSTLDPYISQIIDTLKLAKKDIQFKSSEYTININTYGRNDHVDIEFLGISLVSIDTDELKNSHAFKYFVNYLLKANKFDDFERKVLKLCISKI